MNEYRGVDINGKLCYKVPKSDYEDDGAVVVAKRIAKTLL